MAAHSLGAAGRSGVSLAGSIWGGSAVAVLQISPDGAHMLSEVTGSCSWEPAGRWPAAGVLDAIVVAVDVPVPVSGELRVDLGQAIPPGPLTLSPQELNELLGGALFGGPWIGYSTLKYPPDGPTGQESQPERECGTRTAPEIKV